MEGKYGAIDTDGSSCHGYYTIKFSSSTYILQEDLCIYGKIISSGEMVCEGNYFFPVNINSLSYFLQKTKSINTIFSLLTIINGNSSVIYYYSKDNLPPCLRSISHNYYNTLSPLNITIKESDNIMDENDQIEGIKFDISVLIGM